MRVCGKCNGPMVAEDAVYCHRCGTAPSREPDVSASRIEGTRAPVRIAAAPQGRSAAGESLGFSYTYGPDTWRVLMLGKRQVRMGRMRAHNEIVVRLLPRNAENDLRSMQISGKRPHAVLTLESDGLVLADLKSTNGTTLNGRIVGGHERVPLSQGSKVELAAALKLELRPMAETEVASAPSVRYGSIAQPDELWRLSERLGIRSLWMERLNNLAGEESYAVVYRWINVGRGPGNEVVLPGRGPAGTYVRLVRLGGQFWMEVLAEEGEVILDEVPLRWGTAVGLTAGMAGKIGGIVCRFEEFKQLGL